MQDVVAGLKSQNEDVRRYATGLLALVGNDDEETIPQLEGFLNGEDAAVAESAARALGNRGEPALAPLLNALERAGPDPPIGLIQSLGGMGPRRPEPRAAAIF